MKKTISIILLFILIILSSTKSNATGSINLSANKSSVYIGDEFSISVNLSGASIATLTVRVNVDTTKVDYVSGPSNSSFQNGRAIYTWTDANGGATPITGGTIVTFKFRAKATGIAKFSVNGDFYDANENQIIPSFSGTSVTIENVPITSPPTNVATQPTSNTTSSTTGTTTSTPKTNTQTKITTSTQTLSSNANLKSLQLDVEGINPNFNKNVTDYYIVVSNNIQNIKVTATPEDSSAKVSIVGNSNLKVGTNKISITVISPDNKSKKIYYINVTKSDNPELANANLENLAIENIKLSPEFDTNITEYTVQIDSTQDKLNILAVPQKQNAKIEIQGNDNLQYGDNTVTIKVSAEDGVTVKSYVIKVNRKTPQEEQAMKNENITNEIQENAINNKKKITIQELVFMIIVLGSFSVLVYIIIRKYIKEY